MLAMILAGGRVNDLGVLTFSRPKSAMPFGGLYRIIDFPMSNLMHSGIERVGVLSQYKPLDLMEHIGCGESWDMAGRDRFVTILPPFKGLTTSDWYEGTADAVYQNLDFLRIYKPDLVLILSGDHIYKMDYRQIIAYHQSVGADLTVAFTRVPREGSHRFGLADIEGDDKMGGKVLDYMEKRKDSSYEWASLTIYVFTPYALFEALQENTGADSHEFGRDIIPWLLSKDYRVYGYRHHGYWGYARTLQEYWQTNMDLLGEPCKVDIGSWGVCTNLAPQGARDRQPSLVGPSALIEDSLIYSGCRINGTVRHSVLFPGVKVDFGATVEDSILLSNTMIKQDAVVRKTIADEDTTVGVRTRIGEADTENICVIGKGTRVPKGLIIPSGVTIYPNTGPARFTRNVYEKGEVIQ